MLSLPVSNCIIQERLSIRQCKENAIKFIKECRRLHYFPHHLHVQCAICEKNTLVPTDIQQISETGKCGYCEHVVKDDHSFVDSGK